MIVTCKNMKELKKLFKWLDKLEFYRADDKPLSDKKNLQEVKKRFDESIGYGINIELYYDKTVKYSPERPYARMSDFSSMDEFVELHSDFIEYMEDRYEDEIDEAKEKEKHVKKVKKLLGALRSLMED